MHCLKCGAELPAGAAFCGKCGAPVSVVPQSAPAPAAKSKKPWTAGRVLLWILIVVAAVIFLAYCITGKSIPEMFAAITGSGSDEQAQSVLEQLEKALNDREETVTVRKADWKDSDGDWDDVLYIVMDRINETPEMYFVDWKNTKITLYNEGKSTEQYSLKMTYFSGLKQKDVDKAAEKLLEDIPEDASDWEKALLVHDALIRHVTYKEGKHDQTIYGALVKGEAVCNGYAMAYEYLLGKLDIPCDTVPGFSSEFSSNLSQLAGSAMVSKHAWNVVTFDGKSYCVDVTWDDTNEKDNSGRDYIHYNWFCVSGGDMEKEGRSPLCDYYDLSKWDLDNTKLNYYYANDYVIEKYDYDQVLDILERQLEADCTVLTVRMADLDAYHDAIFDLEEDGDLSRLIKDLELKNCTYSVTYNYTGDGILCLNIFPDHPKE